MRNPRIFVDPASIDVESQTVRIDDPLIANQLLNVLRLRSGARMDILDGQGNIYVCTLQTDRQNHRRCTAVICSTEKAPGEPEVQLSVALPVLKSTRFEWAVEKLTELGAVRIIPLETERSLARGDDGQSNKLKRWRSIAREAAEQCERALVPDVVQPQRLETLLHALEGKGDHAWICAERTAARPLSDLLANEGDGIKSASLVVLVGPEGGFTENEFKIAQDAGVEPITLGKRILRSETAAVYAASLIIGCLDK